MTRRPTTKWYVLITAEDGGTEMFGPLGNFAKASKIADQCRALSGFYTDFGHDAPQFEVELINSQPWPGIRAFRKELA